MLKNYFKIAIRQIIKNKAYAFINIGGLAIGLSAVLLIALYVQFEFSYDTDIKQAGQLYRVNVKTLQEGALIESSARSSPPMGYSFKKEVNAVKDFSRVVILGEAIVGNDGKFTREKDIFLVDEKYFHFFEQKVNHGSAEQMKEPLKVMISEEIASKVFNVDDPVGEVLEINSTNFDGTVNFDIVGVFKSAPGNRHLRPQVLVSYASLYHFMGKEVDEKYEWLNLYTYLKVNNQADLPEIETGLTLFCKKTMAIN